VTVVSIQKDTFIRSNWLVSSKNPFKHNCHS